MIRVTTAIVVVVLATIAAIVSYRHCFEVVSAYGEAGFTAWMVPLTIDGLIYASSMVLLDATRRGVKVPRLARWTLGLGILATLAANVAHGLAHGPVGAIIAAWPAAALVLSYELLLMVLLKRATVGLSPTVEAVAVPANPQHVADLSNFRHGGNLPEALPVVAETATTGPDSTRVEIPAVEAEDVPALPVSPPARTPVLTPALDELFPVAADRYAAEVAEGAVPPLTRIKKDLRVGQPRAVRIRTYLGLLTRS